MLYVIFITHTLSCLQSIAQIWKLDEAAWKQELVASGVSDSYDVSELRYSPEMYTYGVEVTVPSVSTTIYQHIWEVTIDMSYSFIEI